MNETTITRTNPLIDPSVHVWHYEVPVYLFLGGVVAGIMVLTGWWALTRRDRDWSDALALLPWAAPILLSLGMLFLWLDLENRWNAFRFYLVLRPTSPMSWGAWVLVAIYPVTVAHAWASTPQRLRARVLDRLPGNGLIHALSDWMLERARGAAVATVVLGVGLGVYTGVLLGTLAARPLWNSALLGPLFLVSGLSTGAAAMLLARLKDDERRLLGRVDMGFIAVELALLGLWLAGLATGGAASREALGLLWGGAYTASFWTLVVALGLLTPLAAEWLEHRHRVVPGRAAALLVLVGGLALRWILVLAGQHSAIIALH